ncbi:MAG: hypothetical protein K8R50_00430 [Betaproteobacteria bacterium]|nr:hypothetical protein [Betaproteobacteria bacterium]
MALLRESERQDFWAIVVGADFSKEDFNLEEIEDKPTSAGIYAITGTMTVGRKSTGITRQYAAGYATMWLVCFEADLRGHVFGTA